MNLFDRRATLLPESTQHSAKGSGIITETDRILERLLVLRAQAGDDTAFAELVARFSPRLSYFLRKLLGDTHTADDMLQEVWFDVFRALPRLTHPAAFPAWAYRIARDRAFRYLRARGIVVQPLGDSVETLVAADADLSEEFSSSDVALVHEALNELPPEQREVLVLRFLEDLSYEEIARATDSQLGTVRSRLHYAKRALRRALERRIDHE